MILSYKQQFPWGDPTYFELKIVAGLPIARRQQWALENNIYIMPWDGMKPKIHSIREDAPDRWQAGMKIQHAHGVRTKNYRCFLENVCRGIQTIEIRTPVQYTAQFGFAASIGIYATPKPGTTELPSLTLQFFEVIIDGRPLTTTEIVNLTYNDGFDSPNAFFEWFNKPFKGKIIHWTSFKY